MANRERDLLILVGVAWLLAGVAARGGAKKRAHAESDPLVRARCDLRCLDINKPNKSECRSSCRENIVKPGSCPRAAEAAASSREDQWSRACVVACSSDAHCEGIARCCTSTCGAACVDPHDLHTLPGLPAVPVVWNVTERGRASAVRWSAAVGDKARGVPGDVVYVLEEQHHLGPTFDQDKLGEWTPLVRTSKMKASLKDIVKAGRWYRFRVAAVSAEGTRGFSEPSGAFTPRRGPRPPGPPRRPAVTRLHARRANMTALLEWRAPKSDLPLTRYKVFWSRRVRGIDGVLDSVLVNHQLVPPDQTYADIPNLEPNSMYFFQVQAIAQFGLTKLRSEKAATFFNTTNYENDSTTVIEQRKHGQKHKITGIKLNKIIWHNDKLKARVSWNPLPELNGKPRRYMIQWWTGACERENKDHKSRKQLAATTQEHTFELYELSYGCKYRVYINRLPLPARSHAQGQAAPEAVLRFAVPGCLHFQERLNGTLICHQP